MGYFEALWNEAVGAHTPWLVLVLALIVALARALKLQTTRARVLVFFLGLHGFLLALTAGFAARGSALAADVRTAAWVCAAVCFVGCGATLVFSVLLPRLRVRVPRIVEDVLVAVLSVVAGVAVAGRAGVNLSGLIATSAVLTAMLGFSLQDVVGNVAGGLALQLDNSVEVGDWIKVNDVSGRVAEIRWRYTAVETRNWETVLVPNATLVKSQVTVLARRQGCPPLWRRWIHFSVDFAHAPTDVIAAVEGGVRGARVARVADEPPAQCVLLDISDAAAKYALRYWLTDPAVDDPTDSEVRTRVLFALERAGMRLGLPAQTLHVRGDDADSLEAAARLRRERRRALLDRVDIFAGLSEVERDELAAQLRHAPFAAGEVMTRQGAEAHWLYLVETGEASVHVREGHRERRVATLGPGSFFGEMSLLTGAPRSATVVADSAVECFRLDKGAFQQVLERRPELAARVAYTLARRQTELDSAREDLGNEPSQPGVAPSAVDLLARIRAFFGLAQG